MLNISDLASVIHEANKHTDKDEKRIGLQPETTAYAKAIIDTLKSAQMSHDVVAGIAPASMVAVAGRISGMSRSTWAASINGTIPNSESRDVSDEARKSIEYIESNALINFSPGEIVGSIVPTSTASGNVIMIGATGGKLLGLSGTAWSQAVRPEVPTEFQQDVKDRNDRLYNAIVKYLEDNILFSYIPGTITNTTCVLASGVIAPTSGSNGLIS